MLDAGTIVTLPRIAADNVITEFGIAKLNGLTGR
jgi:acyl-CoA hydrolase